MEISEDKLREVLHEVFISNQASFTEKGDEYHDDYYVGYNSIINTIIFRLKNDKQ